MIPAAGQYSHLFVSAELLRSPIRVNSKSEIVRAGKILRENLTEEAISEIEASRGLTILEAFKIAHAWRDAHMRPLMRVRQELGGKLGSIERGAISAARLKRMTSIRKKITATNHPLPDARHSRLPGSSSFDERSKSDNQDLSRWRVVP